jgi:hypothetical protein
VVRGRTGWGVGRHSRVVVRAGYDSYTHAPLQLRTAEGRHAVEYAVRLAPTFVRLPVPLLHVASDEEIVSAGAEAALRQLYEELVTEHAPWCGLYATAQQVCWRPPSKTTRRLPSLLRAVVDCQSCMPAFPPHV